MKECCGRKGCGSEQECVPGHGGCEEDGYDREHCHVFLELADCAWMNLLKEKIKEQIEATDGERMKELAKIVSESNRQRWKNKMGKKRQCDDFEEKLCSFFEKSKK